MIQDIEPSRLDIAFRRPEARPEDFILRFDGEGRLLVRAARGAFRFTSGRDLSPEDALYLFSVDYEQYFLASEEAALAGEDPSLVYRTVRELRDLGGGKELFAAFTAYHLWRWYADNRFCGRCGGKNRPDSAERALRCAACGHVVYPRINPAVIVGVIKGDSLLITRYRTGYAHNALVAGFTEIGETLEDTVRREVMEETGVAVRNIRYYKSQPWGMAQDILAGFFCDADPDAMIRMDPSELKYAEWVPRREIVLQPNNLSLTNEMMTAFRDGREG